MTFNLTRTDKSVSKATEVLLALTPAYFFGVVCAGLLGVTLSWQVALTLIVTAFVGASLSVTVE